MVTHWSVYSDAAVEVSTGLIGARAAAPGIGTAEALRQTVLEMLERHAGDPRRGHPAYWAPFAVIAAR